MKVKNTFKKEQKEAVNIIRSVQKSKVKVPSKEKNIIDYSFEELKAYVEKECKGMSLKKRMKFGDELLKKIKEEKAKSK